MEPLDMVDALARKARLEAGPETDVRLGALLRGCREEERYPIAPLGWSAAISALAAVVVLGLALHQNVSAASGQSSGTTVDSITPLFNAAQVQMP
jgi:hypothetical protein